MDPRQVLEPRAWSRCCTSDAFYIRRSDVASETQVKTGEAPVARSQLVGSDDWGLACLVPVEGLSSCNPKATHSDGSARTCRLQNNLALILI